MQKHLDKIFAKFCTKSSNQADDYNFVYKISCEEIRRQMVLNGLSAKVALTKQQTAMFSGKQAVYSKM